MHKNSARVTPGVGGKHALLVSQDHQGVGLDQVGHQRAKGVVISKFDFIGNHRVVLIDHWHHAELEQGQQGGAGIEVALAVGQIGVCQQHLGTAQTVFAQLGLVHLRQAHLPNGRCRLELMDFIGAVAPAQPLHSLGDGATGDHDDFAPTTHQLRQLAAPLPNRRLVEASAIVGHQARAHLDHNAAGIAQQR